MKILVSPTPLSFDIAIFYHIEINKQQAKIKNTIKQRNKEKEFNQSQSSSNSFKKMGNCTTKAPKKQSPDAKTKDSANQDTKKSPKNQGNSSKIFVA